MTRDEANRRTYNNIIIFGEQKINNAIQNCLFSTKIDISTLTEDRINDVEFYFREKGFTVSEKDTTWLIISWR